MSPGPGGRYRREFVDGQTHGAAFPSSTCSAISPHRSRRYAETFDRGRLDADCNKSAHDCKASRFTQSDRVFRLANDLPGRPAPSTQWARLANVERNPYHPAAFPGLSVSQSHLFRCFRRPRMNFRNTTLRKFARPGPAVCRLRAWGRTSRIIRARMPLHRQPALLRRSLRPRLPAAAPPPTASTIPPVEYAAIITEIQQLGPAIQRRKNALLEDMKHTDPTLWPQLVQTFRSSIAYHKQLEVRRLAALPQNVQTASSHFPRRTRQFRQARFDRRRIPMVGSSRPAQFWCNHSQPRRVQLHLKCPPPNSRLAIPTHTCRKSRWSKPIALSLLPLRFRPPHRPTGTNSCKRPSIPSKPN